MPKSTPKSKAKITPNSTVYFSVYFSRYFLVLFGVSSVVLFGVFVGAFFDVLCIGPGRKIVFFSSHRKAYLEIDRVFLVHIRENN